MKKDSPDAPRERPTDPMENWLMKPALEWLEQAEHGENKERCKNIAVLLRTLWAGDKSNLVPCAPDMKRSEWEPCGHCFRVDECEPQNTCLREPQKEQSK